MLNKIILGAVFIVLVAMVISLTKSSEPVQNNIAIETPAKIDIKDDIEVLYLEDKKEEVKIVPKKTILAKAKKDDKIDFENINVEDLEGEDIQKYIEHKGLKKVSLSKKNGNTDEVPRFSIYSNINLEEAEANIDSNLPPSTPVVANGTFKSGQYYTVVIPNSVKAQSTTLIITKNDNNGNAEEVIEISPQKQDSEETNIFIAPPTIGQ